MSEVSEHAGKLMSEFEEHAEKHGSYDISKNPRFLFERTDLRHHLYDYIASLESQLADNDMLIKKMITTGWEMAGVLSHSLGYGSYMRRWGKIIGEGKTFKTDDVEKENIE